LGRCHQDGKLPQGRYSKGQIRLRWNTEGVHIAERGAIEVYANIIKFLQTEAKDPITFHVIRHIMGEEMHHEEEVETLLGI